jgi:thioredoxin reductase (NADPH)
MQDRAFENDKIEFRWNSVVKEILGSQEGGVHGVMLEDLVTGELTELPVQGVFVAIGHKPNTDIFRGQLEMNDVGYLKVAEPSTKTDVEGVFACGDAMDPIYRQAVTAAGSGCRAAMDAERWLETQD